MQQQQQQGQASLNILDEQRKSLAHVNDQCQKADELIELTKKKRDKQVAKNPNKSDPNIQMEIDRMKEKVLCSLCRKKDKNAMLIHCKHLFCIDCLRVRYESRQRQCPSAVRNLAKTSTARFISSSSP